KLDGKPEFTLDDRSSIGAIIKYITEEKKNFQPMGPNFGVIRSLDERIRDKKEKYNKISKIALDYLETKISEI
ncbi:MAG: FADH(2)-oxidizing methylenetetrahydrofolate--tRNA-(uracil(54)-C(5))-methyltransferase TrmFO, partial [Fusobacteriaceae bacterium]